MSVVERAALSRTRIARAIEPIEINVEQERFLLLHARHLVTKWAWVMKESMLRAYTDAGMTATIARSNLVRLIETGHCTLHDVAHIKITSKGREAVR